MTNRVKVGIVGAGGISYTYLKNLTETFHITEVVGIADIIEERSKRRAEQFHIRQMTVEEIMNDPEIEIVVNLTYPLSHYIISKQALESGKHVFAEKMMSTDFESALELYQLAQSKGLRIGQAPDTFLGGALQTARNLIDKGFIGEPVNAQAMVARCYNLTQDENHPDLPFVFTAGGSIPYDMGCYYLHALIHLLGPVKTVAGLSKTFHPKEMQRNPRNPGYNKPFDMKFPTSMTGALDFYNGCYGTFTAISDSHREETARLEIYGTEGTLILQDPNYFLDRFIWREARGEKKWRPCLSLMATGCIILFRKMQQERKEPGSTATAESVWRIWHGPSGIIVLTAAAGSWDCMPSRFWMVLRKAAGKKRPII